MEELDTEMLEKHEVTINENILPRLQKVEEVQETIRAEVSELKNNLTLLQKGQSDLQITVMKDGQATRDLQYQMKDIQQEQKELQQSSNSMINTLLGHVLKQDSAKQKTNEKVTLKQLSMKEKIILGVTGTLFGTGGLAGIIAAFQVFFQ
ncbi:hypothetical protein H4O14_02410 [Bacillus sp. PAMC26568]|nr:hypothetical protein H4O14_02410 [Bacillus sp. PAMC26568]